MLQALLVTFREGIESFLIVGVVIAYLKKSQRPGLVRGVKIGLAISLVSCTAGAWLWLQVPNQPLYEGIAALTAAVVVGLLLVQMLRAGRHMRARDRGARRSDDRAGEAGAAPSARAIAGVALVTALLVTREGLEAVFYPRRAGAGAARRRGAVAGRPRRGRRRPRPRLRGDRRLGVDALRAAPEPGRDPQGDRAVPRPVSAAAGHLRRPRAGRERRHQGDAGLPRRDRAVRPRRPHRPRALVLAARRAAALSLLGPPRRGRPPPVRARRPELRACACRTRERTR